MRRIAVIDIGSNSIKCLVAAEQRRGGVVSLYENTLPVRISKGISGEQPKLTTEAIMSGSEAVFQLYTECQRHGPIDDTLMVATSAVRDASNGVDFTRLIYEQTGTLPRILSGDDEARLIGQGVIEDPVVNAQYQDFVVADLGGGSLELIAFRNEKLDTHRSIPLGAVRLTEKFFSDPKAKPDEAQIASLSTYVREKITASGFTPQGPIIGTGGMVTVWRSMDAHAANVTLPELSPTLKRASLQSWIQKIARMSWTERLSVPGLPTSRADIVLPGMLIIDTVLDLAGVEELLHSRFNLRFGVAAEWFAQNPARD